MIAPAIISIYYRVPALDADIVALAAYLVRFSVNELSPLSGIPAGMTGFRRLVRAVGLNMRQIDSIDHDTLASRHSIGTPIEAIMFCSFSHMV